MTPADHLIEAARCIREAGKHLDTACSGAPLAVVIKVEAIEGQLIVGPSMAEQLEALAATLPASGMDMRAPFDSVWEDEGTAA